MQQLPHDFPTWNEQQFQKFHAANERSQHPNPIIRWITGHRVTTVIKLIDAQKTDNIVEIGCGSGAILQGIQKGKITGIDLFDTALTVARKLLPPTTILLKADAQKTTLASNKYNKIICTEVLEHLPEPQKVIMEMLRIGNPDSHFVISVPNQPLIDFLTRIICIFRPFVKHFFHGCDMHADWHLHKFTPQLFKQLTRNKLHILKIIRSPNSLLPLSHIYLCRKSN